MIKHCSWIAVLLLAVSAPVRADDISFSTFVSTSNINAAEGGNNSTIAFTFAGNKFVGSVYLGTDNNQLYQTNLSGGGVTQFGSPIPGASGEVVVGASLGQGGFAAGNIYAGSQANGQIYRFANGGGAPALFATLPGAAGAVRQIFFDPGSSFGGNMLVSTTSGNIYTVNSLGVSTLLKSVGEDTEGMDIATSAWGKYAGNLLVTSEGSGTLRLISSTGVVTVVGSFPGAETVSAVPLTLNASDPLQGFYVANYASNIQFAAASNFAGLLGDVVVTNEFGGSTAWDVHYNGDALGTFTITPFTFTGNAISQFEDGIFVTPTREIETGTPEPSSLLMLGTGMLGLGASFLKRKLFS
jgi:hypothetical protein